MPQRTRRSSRRCAPTSIPHESKCASSNSTSTIPSSRSRWLTDSTSSTRNGKGHDPSWPGSELERRNCVHRRHRPAFVQGSGKTLLVQTSARFCQVALVQPAEIGWHRRTDRLAEHLSGTEQSRCPFRVARRNRYTRKPLETEGGEPRNADVEGDGQALLVMPSCAYIVALPRVEIAERIQGFADVSSIADLFECREALLEQRTCRSVVGLTESDESQIHERKADALRICQLRENRQTLVEQPARLLVVSL